MLQLISCVKGFFNTFSQALLSATATDIQDIADILGVTFQEHCVATALKVNSQDFNFGMLKHST